MEASHAWSAMKAGASAAFTSPRSRVPACRSCAMPWSSTSSRISKSASCPCRPATAGCARACSSLAPSVPRARGKTAATFCAWRCRARRWSACFSRKVSSKLTRSQRNTQAMGWNEPGNGKDPWGRQAPGRKPPDLDELLRRLKARLSGGAPGRPPSFSAFAIAGAIVFIWILSGIYIIEPAERGVVLQFGRHVATTGPGPHWHLPFPIQRVEKVNVDQVHPLSDNAVMLTQDENIVNVELAVQYRVSKAEDYLFNVRDPEDTLREATRSAVREVVGANKVDFVMGECSVEVAQQTQAILQGLLDSYKAGLTVTTLTLLDVQPPEPVQPAFDDVTRAREDEAKKKNEAEAYSNAIPPTARGEAARLLAEAEAYRSRVVERAKGEAARF